MNLGWCCTHESGWVHTLMDLDGLDLTLQCTNRPQRVHGLCASPTLRSDVCYNNDAASQPAWPAEV